MTPDETPAVRDASRVVADVIAGAAHVMDGSKHVEHPRAEAQEMLAALLDVPRSWPLLNSAAPLEEETCVALLRAAAKRAAGAPLQYAVGRAPFRHLTLDVDERVLIPRLETELLIDLVLEAEAGRSGGTVVDVGTGSGAIAIALACEARFDRVIAIDLSLDALTVARANAAHAARSCRVPVEFRHGSLLAPLHGERVRAVISNPPYIAQGEAAELPPSVRDWEPAVALYSGPTGMDATVRLVREAADALEPDGLLAMEVDARRAALAAECVAADGRYSQVRVRFDLTGRERFVLARRLG